MIFESYLYYARLLYYANEKGHIVRMAFENFSNIRNIILTAVGTSTSTSTCSWCMIVRVLLQLLYLVPYEILRT